MLIHYRLYLDCKNKHTMYIIVKIIYIYRYYKYILPISL